MMIYGLETPALPKPRLWPIGRINLITKWKSYPKKLDV
jgi:hypothetical protein